MSSVHSLTPTPQLRALLAELERTDTYFVFAEPVNTEEVYSCKAHGVLVGPRKLNDTAMPSFHTFRTCL